MDMDQERIDQISRTLAAGNSRRRILRLLGLGGASGLLAVVGNEAIAGERPHQRLQDRSKQRNRKQRNKNKNTNNTNGGGDQLGSGQPCEAQCQEQFEGCMEPCAGSPSSLDFCVTRCEEQQGECEDRCPQA